MVRFRTNVMISNKPYFLKFACFKAPLMIEEREAWKRRHDYNQAMAPLESSLFFVSKKDTPSFINDKQIDEVSLNSDADRDRRILNFLVHQALKILLESNGFTKWWSFYSKKDYMMKISGRFGLSYDVFNGVKPRVSFENGYSLIAFEYGSMIFARFPTSLADRDALKELYLVTLCDDCRESSTCKYTSHKASKLLRVSQSRVFMIDVEGKEFNCPITDVRIESNPRTMKGEYARILRSTAPTTYDEHQFLFDCINAISGGNLVLNLGVGIAFSWLEMEAQS